MQNRKRTFDRIFFIVSALAALFVLAEIIMQSFGSSICLTEGCKVVSQQARYGESSILALGIATFLVLSLLSAQSLFFGNTKTDRLIDLLLIVSLAGEGFFTAYQAFSIRTACLFCLIVFAIFVVLGVIRLLSGRNEVLAGFASLLAVFGMFYLVPPASVAVDLPLNERLILFYSKDCKHCKEVLKELDEMKIAAKHLEVEGYAGFLKNLGIDSVPTLLVNGPYQKTFLTGAGAIGQYLAACTEKEKKTGAGASDRSSEYTEPAVTIDIFGQQEVFSVDEGPAAAEGMCKEDTACD